MKRLALLIGLIFAANAHGQHPVHYRQRPVQWQSTQCQMLSLMRAQRAYYQSNLNQLLILDAQLRSIEYQQYQLRTVEAQQRAMRSKPVESRTMRTKEVNP